MTIADAPEEFGRNGQSDLQGTQQLFGASGCRSTAPSSTFSSCFNQRLVDTCLEGVGADDLLQLHLAARGLCRDNPQVEILLASLPGRGSELRIATAAHERP